MSPYFTNMPTAAAVHAASASAAAAAAASYGTYPASLIPGMGLSAAEQLSNHYGHVMPAQMLQQANAAAAAANAAAANAAAANAGQASNHKSSRTDRLEVGLLSLLPSSSYPHILLIP